MNWKEQLASSRNIIQDVPEDRAKIYDNEKEKSIPVIARDGDKPFEQVNPQPVISPGIYEAEFFTKGKDVLFHFWPHGYHAAEEQDKIPPRFPRMFASVLKDTITTSLYPSHVEIHEDRDMGAWFVKAKDMAERPFAKDLAIKAMEEIHRGMGGEPTSTS